jgi:hypothetical protein
MERFGSTCKSPSPKRKWLLCLLTLKASYYEHVMSSSAQQFTDVVVVAERIEQGVKSGRISAPMEKKEGFWSKKEGLIMSKVAIKARKANFKDITLHHPKLPTSISTSRSQLENLNPKTTK